MGTQRMKLRAGHSNPSWEAFNPEGIMRRSDIRRAVKVDALGDVTTGLRVCSKTVYLARPRLGRRLHVPRDPREALPNKLNSARLLGTFAVADIRGGMRVLV